MAALALIRPYVEADYEAVMALRQREGLERLDPGHPLNMGLVIERDGRMAAAGWGRSTAELFLTQDRTVGDPAERWQDIQALLAAASQMAKHVGLEELHIFVPQGLARYKKRLETIPGVFPDDRFHLILATGERWRRP